MARDEVIRIEGLREFRAKLRTLDRNAPKGIRVAGNRAADLVVDEARPRVPVRTGRARASVRAASTSSAARVRGGGKRVPYYPWLDFGGRVGRGKSIRRPFLKDGRYIWRAFADNRAQVRDELRDALADAARAAGLEPR